MTIELPLVGLAGRVALAHSGCMSDGTFMTGVTLSITEEGGHLHDSPSSQPIHLTFLTEQGRQADRESLATLFTKMAWLLRDG